MSAVCSANNYDGIRKIDSTVFTECLPQNTNFNDECKKINEYKSYKNCFLRKFKEH